MYEYSPRPLRRALPTAAAVLLPKRFWKSFSLEMPPQMARLRAWRRIALLIIVIGIVTRCSAVAYYSYGRLASGQSPHLGWLRFPVTLVVVLLGIPLITAFLLPGFTATLSKFRIRDDQIARCMAFAYTGVAWSALALTAAGLARWLGIVVDMGLYVDYFWDSFLCGALDALAGLSLATVALWWPRFLYVALKDYLRLSASNAFALVLSTQAIAWLTVLIPIVTSSNWLSKLDM
jgi:hypothetical protein